MIEVENFLSEMEIIDDKRTAIPNAKGVLIVCDRPALCRGQNRIAFGDLVKFATLAAHKFLIVDGGLIRDCSRILAVVFGPLLWHILSAILFIYKRELNTQLLVPLF
ncbi:hypothetical protein RvVAR031_40280 [Agrobacterium vitis]|nr:hypothetical protein RvVAR031_40280 [Agrobacterium vitis]